jgi:hypothetical protein
MFFSPYISSLKGLGADAGCWSSSQLFDYARSSIPQDTISDDVLNQIVSAIYSKYQVSSSGSSVDTAAIEADVTSMVTNILDSNYSGLAYASAGLRIRSVVGSLSDSGYSLVPLGACQSSPQAAAGVAASITTPSYGGTPVPVRSVQQAQAYVQQAAPLLSEAQMNAVVKKIMKQGVLYEKTNQQSARIWPWIVVGLGVTFLFGVVTYRYVRRREPA